MNAKTATIETKSEAATGDGELLVELLRLFGWRVGISVGRQPTARASRGGLTLSARGKTRAEAVLWLFEAAIEARHAAARAA